METCPTWPRCVLLALIVVLVPCAAWAGDDVWFDRDIRPILSENCFFCHGPDAGQRQADLRLDTKQGAAAVLSPGKSGASELYRRLTTTDTDERMPPADSQRALSPRQIELVKRWIDQGAPWGEHWAFTPIHRPAVPSVPPNSDAPQRNPIDAFVQARLAREGVTPSPEAPRAMLIRRVTLDLTGLPPKPDEVDAFVRDDAPDAYEKVVDRLLASPAFGERMAWDWLDAARYADSNGYQGDRERTMWPWRDWVVRAFNANLPYDQFTVWQLAGDLLPEAGFEQTLATGFCRNHMINGEGGRIPEENRVDYVMDMSETTATVWLGLTLGCCRCHDHKYDPLTRRDYYRMFAFFNHTPVTGGGGDPQTPPVLAVPTPAQQRRLDEAGQQLAALDEQLGRRAAELADGQAAWEQRTLSESAGKDSSPLLEALRTPAEQRNKEQADRVTAAYRESDETYRRLRTERESAQKERDAAQKAIPKVMVMHDQPEPRKTYMLDRGLYNQPGDEVTAETPAFLPPRPADTPANRLGLARWLVAADNPLTARVTVNRLWQQVFGIGLVKTTEDFGVQGEIPIHRELLDWLAAEFRGSASSLSPPLDKGGPGGVTSASEISEAQPTPPNPPLSRGGTGQSAWNVKHLVRLIVTSHTYRQSSKVTAALAERDLENRLLARGARFRMPSWMLRDQALGAAGLLVPRLGGPPVNPYQPAGVWEEATFGNKRYVQDHGDALYRRSLYTFWRRIVAPTMFFDNASRQTCTVKVFRTNTPLHALLTLNDTTYVEAARALAARVLLSDATDDARRLDLAFRRLLARPASPAEHAILLAGLERSRAQFQQDADAAKKLLSVGESPRNEQLDPAEHASWTALCLAILNFDETLTKE